MPNQGTKITMRPSKYDGFTVYMIKAETRAAMLEAVAQIKTMTRVEEFRPYDHPQYAGWAELEVQDLWASSPTLH